MQNGERLSLEQMRAFLEASQEVAFEAANRSELYGWITRTLCQQEYWKQGREVKGLVRQYVMKMTGLSRAQVTRLISQYVERGAVQERVYRRNRFSQPVHGGRYRTARDGGRSTRDAERAGHAEDSVP